MTDTTEPEVRDVRSKLPFAVTPASIVWLSTVMAMAGFGLLAYTWVKVSTLTIVAAQVPYLVSSGMTGLGLIVVGAAGIVVWSRRADDAARARQAEELVAALRDIKTGLDATE